MNDAPVCTPRRRDQRIGGVTEARVITNALQASLRRESARAWAELTTISEPRGFRAFTLLAGCFALWTHGAVPYDPLLAITLLIGTCVVAPSILALGDANYRNSGDLRVCGRSGFT